MITRRSRRPVLLSDTRWLRPPHDDERSHTRDQPLPSVDPALDFAPLDELSLARVFPALDSADLDGLAILITSSRGQPTTRHRQISQNAPCG